MNFRRRSYQFGSVSRESRKAGPDVWIFRFRERTTTGNAVNRKMILGTIAEFPTKAQAWKEAETLRTQINAEHSAVPMALKELVTHYKRNELVRKAHSTQRTLSTTLDGWILPKWGQHTLMEVRTVDVEDWLRGLPLANPTKAKIRNTMHALFAHACRHQWQVNNPISLVRQSGKRQKIPVVLELQELKDLLPRLENPTRLLVFLIAATGLRISEALGLKWCDINIEAGEISLTRSIVQQHVGNMKTEASEKPLPIAGSLLNAIRIWSQKTNYNQPDDWVFASPQKSGKQPYWPETPLRCFVQPAAKRAGITKTLGWHTFRRTFATLLSHSGEDVKTVQELMRHANSRLTLDLYAQAINASKRAAHLKLVGLIDPGEKIQSVPLCSHEQFRVAVSN
jgi:integrase